MLTADRSTDRARTGGGTLLGAAAVVMAPLALLVILRVRPELDVRWDNQPAHFWLVLGAAAIATTLGYTLLEASRRRRDARLLMISLAFIAGAGFLGLHALATPGVLVGPNAGFHLATPVGLVLGSVLVAISTLEFRLETARRIMARSRLLLAVLVAIMIAWAAVSLAEIPPLDEMPDETVGGWLLAFAALGILGYGMGAVGYLRLYLRRGARVVLAFAVAFGLLAVTMVVVAFAANWRLSWWEWHVLVLAALGLIAAAARREWYEERFSALYLEQTLEGTQEVSILFADLQGFTAFSERTEPRAVQDMLNTYFSRLVPLVREHGAEVHQLIGDAIMVVFNKHGDQPDHALLATRAALAFQQAANEIADAHPDWPRFRAGINSGEVASGVLGEHGHRKHDVIGDTVNLAARLEAEAPVGQVVIGAGTLDRLPDGALLERLPPLEVKGKAEPVTAYVLHRLPDDAG